MSYMTHHRLEIKNPQSPGETGKSPDSSQVDQEDLPTLKAVAEHLATFAKPTAGPAYYPKREKNALWEMMLSGDGEADWTHRQEEMTRVSRNWPGVLFEITGTGEDSTSDSWREYYLDGKVHLVFGEMAYPGFEPDKLAGPEIIQEEGKCK